MRPFRFLADPSEVVDGATLADTARRAEAMGYSALVIPDHLVEVLAPVPAMATIAAATDRIRIGTFVFNNDLRHPAVLAHDLASLDVLSAGRLEIGIGAGWNVPEYEAIGLPFDRTPVRVERMKEAVAVLKGCFGPGPFSYSGTYYTIGEYDFLPKPVQKPHPPILVGGGGRRTLEFAAREANTVGLAPRILANGRGDPRSITVAATAEKIEWIRGAAGDRFADLELNIYPSMSEVIVTDHARDEARTLIARLHDRTGYELTEDDVLEAPHIFIGTIDFLVDKFVRLRQQLGISSILLGGVDELAPVVERLAGT